MNVMTPDDYANKFRKASKAAWARKYRREHPERVRANERKYKEKIKRKEIEPESESED